MLGLFGAEGLDYRVQGWTSGCKTFRGQGRGKGVYKDSDGDSCGPLTTHRVQHRSLTRMEHADHSIPDKFPDSYKV